MPTKNMVKGLAKFAKTVKESPEAVADVKKLEALKNAGTPAREPLSTADIMAALGKSKAKEEPKDITLDGEALFSQSDISSLFDDLVPDDDRKLTMRERLAEKVAEKKSS